MNDTVGDNYTFAEIHVPDPVHVILRKGSSK